MGSLCSASCKLFHDSEVSCFKQTVAVAPAHAWLTVPPTCCCRCVDVPALKALLEGALPLPATPDNPILIFYLDSEQGAAYSGTKGQRSKIAENLQVRWCCCAGLRAAARHQQRRPTHCLTCGQLEDASMRAPAWASNEQLWFCARFTQDVRAALAGLAVTHAGHVSSSGLHRTMKVTALDRERDQKMLNLARQLFPQAADQLR